MLTHVYRYGPSRQRILKGFVVAGQQPGRILSQVLKEWPAPASGALALRTDSRFPVSVWLDTGLVWLHTPQARSRCFSQLAAATRTLTQAVRKAGGQLLPNAIRLSAEARWEEFLCGDRHLLETFDDSEKEVYCNLLRVHLPVLIALTGRAGVSPVGVEPIASRRLADSSHHLAARYLASVSPRHLQRVVQCLRRDQGVGRLELLDVCPTADNDHGGVEVRFTDGQILLSSVRAHALLYQALLIKARRLTRNGRRIGNVRQSFVERNRARAITDGLQARLEAEAQGRDEGRAPRTHAQQRPAGKGTDERERNRIEFLLAREAALALFEDLAGEFHVLEVEFGEIAPLVMGAGLRAIGLPGLQNESDLMREWSLQGRAQGFDIFSHLPSLMGQFLPEQDDPLTLLNKQRFGRAGERLQRWWELMLKAPVASRGEGRPASRTRQEQRTQERRAEHERRPVDRGPREGQGAGSQAAHSQDGRPQQGQRGRPNPERDRSHELPGRAAAELLKALRGLGASASKADCAAALLAFHRSGRTTSLNRAARALSQSDAEELGRLVESALTRPHVSDDPSQGWEAQACLAACQEAVREGLATLLLRAPAEQEERLHDAALRMTQKGPQGVTAFFLYRQSYNVGGAGLAGVRLVLARTDLGADNS